MGYTSSKITLIDGSFNSSLDIQINGVFETGVADINMTGDLTVSSSKTMTSGNGGDWTFAGDFTVLGTADINGANVDVTGKFTVKDGGVTNAGTGTHIYRGLFEVGNNATLHIEDAAMVVDDKLHAQNGAIITIDDGRLEIHDELRLQHSATLSINGAGSLDVEDDVKLQHSGVLNVGVGNVAVSGEVDAYQSGFIHIDGGFVQIGGDFYAKHDGGIDISGGQIQIDGKAEFKQSGKIEADSGTVIINGNFDLLGGGAYVNAGAARFELHSNFNLSSRSDFRAESSLVDFNGATSQGMIGDVTFWNMTVSNTSTLFAQNADLQVLNTEVVEAGSNISSINQQTIEVQGPLMDPSYAAASEAPFVRNLVAVTSNVVRVEFSESLVVGSTSNLSNFSVNNGNQITAVNYTAGSRLLFLTLRDSLDQSLPEYRFVFNNVIGTVNNLAVSLDHTKRYPYQRSTRSSVSVKKASTGTQPTSSSVTVNIQQASGAVVLIRSNAPPSLDPNDFTSTRNPGDTLSDGSRLVHNGTDDSLAVLNLKPNRNYFVQAVGYVGPSPDGSSFDPYSVSIDSLITPFELDMTVVLSGAFNDDSLRMISLLAEKGLLPLSQPFAANPWSYNGTESVPAIPSNEIADWVLLELRVAQSTATADENTIAHRGAYFLMEDGSIVGIDGVSLPLIQLDNPGSFVAILYHRNHLPIVSSDTLTLDGNNRYSIDFASNSGAWYETNSARTSPNGLFMSSSGFSTSDGTNYEVDNGAYSQAWNNRNNSGYNSADVDMDGEVTASDRASIFNSKESKVTLPNSNAQQGQGQGQ